jgi:hypothetical protein
MRRARWLVFLLLLPLFLIDGGLPAPAQVFPTSRAPVKYPQTIFPIGRFPAPAGSLLTGFYTSFWKMADLSDSIGTMTLTNSAAPVTFSAGKIGNAGNFVAASATNLSHVDDVSLRGTTSFTVSFWLKLTDRTAPYAIFTKSLYSVSNSGEFGMDVNNGGTAGKVRFFIENGATFNILTATNAIPDTNYHFVVAWWDSVAAMLNLSIDGGAATQQATTATPAGTAVPFVIGADGNVAPGLPLNGQVDTFGFVKGKTPSAAQIAAGWNAGVGAEPPF